MILPACSRLIVIGDIHGDLQRFIRILHNSKVINENFEWVAEPRDTIVVQLGDQIDSATRGSTDDWETMPDTEVLRFADHLDTIAMKQGGRVVSILGNHEIMNVVGDFMYVSKKSLEAGGGIEQRHLRFRPGGCIARILAHRPVVAKIGDCLFCHAGLLPYHLDMVNDNIESINLLCRKFLMGFTLNAIEERAFHELFMNQTSILWNRQYTTCSLENRKTLENVLNRTKCKVMYIGHNVVPQITAMYDRSLFFVDTGLSRAFNTPSPMILDVQDAEKSSPTYRAMPIGA
jgi:hypothetical protein